MNFFQYLFWFISSIVIALFLFFAYRWIKRRIFYMRAILLLKKEIKKSDDKEGIKLLREIIKDFKNLKNNDKL